MHPTVRVVCLLVFAVCIARTGPGGLVAGGFLLLAGSILIGSNPWFGLAKLLRRVRWLVASLILVYGWFTSKTNTVSGFDLLVPDLHGLAEGSLRVAALLAMVMAMHLLLKVTVKEQLMLALHQLTTPFALVRFPRERLVARMVLVLDAVPRVQEIVATQRQHLAGDGSLRLRMARTSRGIFDSILSEAERQVVGPVTLAEPTPVPWVQWFYPVLIVALIGLSSKLLAV